MTHSVQELSAVESPSVASLQFSGGDLADTGQYGDHPWRRDICEPSPPPINVGNRYAQAFQEIRAVSRNDLHTMPDEAGSRSGGQGEAVAEHLSQALSALDILERRKQNLFLRRQIEKEKVWLTRNRNAYRGLWIALEGDRLLASGTSSKEVFSKVADRTPPPLVIQIPEEDLPFAGW